MTNSQKKVSALAIASLALAIAGSVRFMPFGYDVYHSLGLSGLGPFVLFVSLVGFAIVLGIAALLLIRASGYSLKGVSIASAGLILSLATAGFFLTVIFVLRPRLVRHYSICGRNIQMIERARSAAGQDENYYAEPAKQIERIIEHLPNGRLPECPGGGRYTVHPTGYGDKCSKHGDHATCMQGI